MEHLKTTPGAGRLAGRGGRSRGLLDPATQRKYLDLVRMMIRGGRLGISGVAHPRRLDADEVGEGRRKESDAAAAGTRSVPQSRYERRQQTNGRAPHLGTAAVDLWPRPDSNRRHSA
jgi:hypothetical protein